MDIISLRDNQAHFLVVILFFLIILLSPQVRAHIRSILKYILFENYIVTLLRNKALQLILPGFAGAYYLCLDVWGDDWPIIIKYKDLHSTLFTYLITLSLIVLTLRGIADHILEKKEREYISFIEGFSLLTTRLVKTKLDRFKRSATNIKQNGNTFKLITKPDDQINLILTEVESLFRNHLKIREELISITIIRKTLDDDSWYYAFKNHPHWNRTRAKTILLEDSTAASICLSTGEPYFYADKNLAANQGKYYLSDRDKRHKSIGSVYCYPSITKSPTYEDKFIFCIITYEKMLCDPNDTEQTDAIETILTDIARRLDLELTLYAMKSWHQNS
jgi:hypothetical protein